MLLGEETLVLRLEVHSPTDRVVKFLAAVFQNFNRFGVGNALEGFLGDEAEPFHESLVHKTGKDIEVALMIFQGVIDKVFGKFLGKIHISLEVAECHFRLNHPELGGVA